MDERFHGFPPHAHFVRNSGRSVAELESELASGDVDIDELIYVSKPQAGEWRNMPV